MYTLNGFSGERKNEFVNKFMIAKFSEQSVIRIKFGEEGRESENMGPHINNEL